MIRFNDRCYEGAPVSIREIPDNPIDRKGDALIAKIRADTDKIMNKTYPLMDDELEKKKEERTGKYANFPKGWARLVE